MVKEDPRVDRDPATGKPKVDWDKVADPKHEETRTGPTKKS